MDGFKNLEINSFRGIKHLTIDDLSRVNVFLTPNTITKTPNIEFGCGVFGDVEGVFGEYLIG